MKADRTMDNNNQPPFSKADSSPRPDVASEDNASAQMPMESASGCAPYSEVTPWDEPVAPAELLSEIASIIKRFIVCSDETADAAALWVAMTWFMDMVHIAPLAVITAPEKRCGKTQMLTVLSRMCYRPIIASNITPAALFRSIDAWHPTLLIDEADTFMKDNEELRGVINSGHTRDAAYIIRLVGNQHEPRRFDTWSAKAISGIGHLADTLMDRAIVFELRRKRPTESIERLRYAPAGLWEAISRKLARFARDFSSLVKKARPTLPPELNDRAQDNWEPLLQIADVAGGAWPARAYRAALKLSKVEKHPESIGVELLADIDAAFEACKTDKLFTADLIIALCTDDERPWATFNKGSPITPSQMAKLLRPYGISSKTIRICEKTSKGYYRTQFEDAFTRYVRTPADQPSGVTLSHARADGTFAVTGALLVPAVAVTPTIDVTDEANLHAGCDGVTANGTDMEGIVEDEVKI